VDVLPDPVRARRRVTVGAVVVLVLVGLGVAVLVAALGDRGTAAQVSRPTASGTPAAPDVGSIFVHILGAVLRPGLYELRPGDRTVDAVAAAGGFLETADRSGLNLARPLVDGEQLIVPAIGEVPPPAATAGPALVNLNTADSAALETLPRVGPALAARIIDWREANGAFTSIDDLREVSGIGDKTFESLAPLVTV
jgi:competence protein ComEA